jgi:hypothetical protein
MDQEIELGELCPEALDVYQSIFTTGEIDKFHSASTHRGNFQENVIMFNRIPNSSDAV